VFLVVSELNNRGFEIQRKVVEGDFATVGFVKGEGTTTNRKEYSYADKDLADEKYFYRLKQLDFNGEYEYTNTIEVELDHDNFTNKLSKSIQSNNDNWICASRKK
jgi:hypothetical protein